MAEEDLKHLKDSLTQNEQKCTDYQETCEKKLKKIKEKIEELNKKKEEIAEDEGASDQRPVSQNIIKEGKY